MEDFLKKSHLSAEGIELYKKIMGLPYIIKADLEKFQTIDSVTSIDSIIEELLQKKLIIPFKSKGYEELEQYSPIAPLELIIKYYNNIKSSESSIHSQILKYFQKSFHNIKDKFISKDLTNLHKSFSEIFKDFKERGIVQKQDIDDLFEKMEELNKLSKDKFEMFLEINRKRIDLNNDIFLVPFEEFKPKLLELIIKTDIKKNMQDFLNQFENLYNNEINSVIFKKLEKIQNTIKIEEEKFSYDNLINQNMQYRTDLRLLVLNLMNDFELKLNKVSNLLKKYEEVNENKMEELSEKVLDTMDTLTEKSIKDLLGLNNLVEEVLDEYLKRVHNIEEISPTTVKKKNDYDKLSHEEIEKPSLKSETTQIAVKPFKKQELPEIRFSKPKPKVKKLDAAKIPKISKLKQNHDYEVEKELFTDNSHEEVQINSSDLEQNKSSSDNLISLRKESQENKITKEITIEYLLNDLEQNINKLKGYEFSEHLQEIADKILEEKGFSVMLHQIGKVIIEFKKSKEKLTDTNKNLIMTKLGKWKEKLKGM